MGGNQKSNRLYFIYEGYLNSNPRLSHLMSNISSISKPSLNKNRRGPKLWGQRIRALEVLHGALFFKNFTHCDSLGTTHIGAACFRDISYQHSIQAGVALSVVFWKESALSRRSFEKVLMDKIYFLCLVFGTLIYMSTTRTFSKLRLGNRRSVLLVHMRQKHVSFL